MFSRASVSPPSRCRVLRSGPSHQRRSAVAMVSKRVLVPIAHGIEEMEAVTCIDVLRRAGAEVTVASVEEGVQIKASRGVNIVADVLISECTHPFDVICLPGGMPGAERLRDSETLAAMLKEQKESGRLFSAICASPAVVFEPQGLLSGFKATSHPAFSDRLSDQSCVEQRVVRDGRCVTSRGPGTALEFALALTAELFGKEKAREVAAPMVVPECIKTDMEAWS